MKDEAKTKKQLISEIIALRQRVADLELSQTDNKPTEEALEKSEGEYRNLVDNALVGIYKTNLKGDVLYANQALAKIMGFETLEEFISEGVVARYKNPEDRTVLISELVQTGRVESIEIEVITKTGIPRHILLSAVLDGDYIEGMILDITGHKRAEKALRESEEKFRNLAEESPNMIFINQGGSVVYVNEVCEQLMGYSREEFLSPDFDFMRLIAQESIETVQENFRRHMRGQEVPPYEYQLLTIEGKRLDGIHTTRLITYEGQPAILGIVTDITARKQAEEALRESEERYRFLYENTPGLLHSIDRNGRLVSVSNYWLEVLGYERDEVIGRKVTEFFTEASRRYAEEVTLPEFFRAGFSKDVPYQFVKKNGEVIDILLSAIAERDVEGEVSRTLSVSNDVTERKQMEQKLQDSEKRYRALYEEAPIAYYGVGTDGRIRSANPYTAEMSGYALDDLIGRPVVGLYADTPVGKKKAEEMVRRFSAGEEIRGEELEWRTADGRSVWVSLTVRPSWDTAGQVVESRAMAVDITERKQAEQILAEERNLLRTLIDNLPDYIYVLDTESRFIIGNIAVAHLMGVAAPDELIGKTDFDFFPEKLAGQYRADDQAVIRSGKPRLNQEEAVIGPSGSTSWVLTTRVPLQDSQGKMVGLVGISRDITERKHQEQELLETKNLLEKTFASLNEGVLIINPADRTIVRCNPAVESMFGYSVDELIGENTGILHVNQEAYDRFAQVGEPILEESGVFQTEFEMRRRDGQIIITENTVTTLSDERGWTSGVVSVIRDITERKRTEDARRQSEERLRAFANALPDLAFILDEDGRHVEILTGRKGLLPVPADQMKDRLLHDVLPKKEADELLTLVRHTIDTGQPQVLEYALDVSAGQRWFEGRTSPLREISGKDSMVVLISRDVTERKRAEAELTQLAIHLALINDIGSRIAAVLELDSLLDRAARLVQESFDYHHVALFMIDGEVLRLKAVTSLYEPIPASHTQKLSQGINGWVATHGEKIVANDVSAEPRFTFLLGEHSTTQSELCLPIKVAEQTVGVLDIQSPHLNAFDENDVIAMETLTDQIAVAIVNAWYYEQAQQEIVERKRVETALRESEELFRQVVTSISPHIYVTEVTEDGQRLNRYLSPNIESLTGYPYEKFIDDWSFWPSVVIHPEDRGAAAGQAERLAKGQDSKMEYRMVRADDEVIWVRDSGRTKVQGTSRMIYGVVSDITESRWAREEIVRLYTAERDRYHEAEALRQAALALASTIELDQVIEHILVELQNVVPYDSVSVQLLQEDELRIIGGRGFPNPPELIGRSFPVSEEGRVGLVLKSSEPVIVDDAYRHDPTYAPMFDLEENHYSWLGVPLCIGERTIGILTVNKQQSSFYTEAHSRQAVAFATQAAVAIENARLHAETQRRVQQLAVMHELDRAISASLHIDEVYQAFSQYTELLLSYDRVSIAFLEEDKLHITYVAGIAEPRVGTKLPSKDSISERVITRRKPLLIDDVTADAYSASEADWATGVKSAMVLPLQAKGQAIGTWNISSLHAGFYEVDDLHIAQMIADQLAVGIENARLYEQAQQEIEERKQAEAALEEERASLARRVETRTAELSVANAELARAARLKDEFLANMSHELRTPLNAILGMSEVLRNEVYGPLTTEQVGALGHIEEGGRHLLELINDILDLSKIEAGKFDLNMGPVWVNDVCQASLLFVKQMAQKKRIKVFSTFDNTVETLQADQRRLKQILVNLLSNAVKFTPEEGQVGLEVESDATRPAVHFTVWDTGIGIAPEAMDKLFKPFVQIDSRLSRQYEGTGLGLSLVRRLAEMHGGGVSVESEVGQGSRFTVSLPWQRESEEAREQGSKGAEEINDLLPSIPAPEHPCTVLLVEDNETNIITIRDFLQNKGYQVIVVRNGIEAIERARDTGPDIILMDIQMPVMDGLEATRRLRADTTPGLATIPIVALTSLAMPGDRERCLAAGANEYLSKPVSLARLVQVIETQLHTVKQKKG